MADSMDQLPLPFTIARILEISCTMQLINAFMSVQLYMMTLTFPPTNLLYLALSTHHLSHPFTILFCVSSLSPSYPWSQQLSFFTIIFYAVQGNVCYSMCNTCLYHCFLNFTNLFFSVPALRSRPVCCFPPKILSNIRYNGFIAMTKLPHSQ